MRGSLRPALALGALSAALALTPALGSTQARLSLESVATGMTYPIWAGSPPGDDRVFVVEQYSGQVLIFENGIRKPLPFLDISAELLPLSHSGFMALAFHPQFATNGHVFVYYTVPETSGMFGTPNPAIVRIERHTVSATDPDVVDPTSAMIVLEHAQPNLIHKGAGPLFGPDGYLYIVLGEGGIGGPNSVDACAVGRLDNWFGKVLRIDVDSATPYAIPPDNPFLQTPGALPEIYHLGLRSPWRASIDWQTGNLYIGDVGAFAYEELHFSAAGQAGLNFGHPVLEGPDCSLDCAAELLPCGSSEYPDPIHSYPNTNSSIICGPVYRGSAMPLHDGALFFADFSSGDLWSLRYDPVAGVSGLQSHISDLDPTGALQLISSFGEDGNGEIMIVTRGPQPGDGAVFRIVPFVSSTYCTSTDLNLPGVTCTPVMSEITGIPSLTLSRPLSIDATQIVNWKNGLFFYGTQGSQAIPFLGGTLCVALPLKRTDLQNAGGTAEFTLDCSGSFHFDFNTWLQTGQDPLIAPGTQVHGQYWFRVPETPSGSGLTDGVLFEVGP